MQGKRGLITEPYTTQIEEYEIGDPTGQVLVEDRGQRHQPWNWRSTPESISG